MKLSSLVNSSKTITLLYVEDEKDSRDDLYEMLQLLFKKVIVASDGLEALEKFKSCGDIDIILTDLMMPNLDGISMIKQVRKIDKFIPIIVLSAYSEVDHFLNVIKLGIDGYLLKPIEYEMLNTVFIKAIEKINLQKENEIYKHNLELKIQEEIDKRLYQEKILIQQSKLAAMGEIIDAIAHQWKQPLTSMSCGVDMLEYDFKDGLIDQQYIENYTIKFKRQLNHALNTLNEFRSFFRPNDKLQRFCVREKVKSALILVEDELKKHQINVFLDGNNSIYLDGNENEFKHIVLNIVNNAKDAFIENNLENREIQINITLEDSLIIEFIDNAGGIPSHIFNDIFKPNISTKTSNKGSGIGLYISSLITQKFDAKLWVEQVPNGSKFIFEK